MAQFRNVSADERMVVYGVPTARSVVPDGVVDVDDAVAGSYESQPAVWRRVDSGPAATAAPSTVSPGSSSVQALKEKVAADQAALAAAETAGTVPA